MIWGECERKAAAFDKILEYYNSQGVDDTESDWQQGSVYDDIVRRFLGIPTLDETIASW